jgi:hypothetical protein
MIKPGRPDKVNLAEAFSRFQDHWNPRIVGDVNDMQVKIVKIGGPFVWHHHETEDELFLAVHGGFTMRFRDGDVEVGEGGVHRRAAWRRALPGRRLGMLYPAVRTPIHVEHRRRRAQRKDREGPAAPGMRTRWRPCGTAWRP